MVEQQVIVAGWYTVNAVERDAVVASFKDLVVRAREAPGCLDVAITADPVSPNRITIFELWRSEADLNSWRAVANAPKLTSPMQHVEIHKHFIDRSGPPFDQ